MRSKEGEPSNGLAWIRVQARNLALKLARNGASQDEINNALHHSGFHPSISHETMLWIRAEAFSEDLATERSVEDETKAKKITCPPCGNILSADTDDELVAIGQEHAKLEHNTYLTAEYILSKIHAC